MNEKNLLKSKTVWIGWGLGLIGGAIAALEQTTATGVNLPLWLAALVPILSVTLLPLIRATTTEIATSGKVAATLVGIGIALGGYAVTLGVGVPMAQTAPVEIPADVIEVVEAEAVEAPALVPVEPVSQEVSNE